MAPLALPAERAPGLPRRGQRRLQVALLEGDLREQQPGPADVEIPLVLRQLVKLTFIPGTWLVPFLLVLLGIGAFTANSDFNDIIVMLVAGVLGVVAIQWDWPRVPFVLAVVLGGLAERYLFLSHELYDWSWLTKPSVLGIAALIILVSFWPTFQSWVIGPKALVAGFQVAV